MPGPGDQLEPIFSPIIDRALWFATGIVIGVCVTLIIVWW